MIVVIDYGMGNLGSIANMFKKIGVPATVTSSHDAIIEATALILPGIGAFDTAMRNLEERQLIPVLQKKVLEERTPALGVCLGMQIMARSSEEGSLAGLGWVDATVKRFQPGDMTENRKIPHMGWNTVQTEKDSSLFANFTETPRFYFVHSYYVLCNHKEDILGTTDYGIPFASALQRDNIFGVQFHPEKSHAFGMQLYKNFASIEQRNRTQ